MTTFPRRSVSLVGLLGLLAIAPAPAFAQTFIGDSQFACSELGGTNCSVAIPDGADPAQAIVEASFTIPQGTPVCAFAAVRARLVLLHSATSDLELTLTHVESGTSINVPQSGGTFGDTSSNDTILLLDTAATAATGVAGVWRVQMQDHYAGDYGNLVDFRVLIDCAIPKAIVSESGTVAGFAEPGETLGYTIVLPNDTPLPIDVRVSDPVPAGTSFVAADNGGSLVAGEIVWDSLTIPANTSLTIGFTVEVESPLAAGRAEISNQATVEGLSDNVLGVTDTSCTPGTGAGAGPCLPTVIPTVASLAPTQKTIATEDGDTAGVAEPGEQIAYSIVLRNDDGIDIAGVDVVDPLPPGTSFVSASDGGTLVGNQIEWTGLTVPAQDQRTLQLVVRVLDQVPQGVNTIVNQATANGAPSCVDVSDPNICNPTVLPLGTDVGPGLKQVISENGDVAGVAEPGELIGYRITLTNTGALDATGIDVVDPIPASTTFVSADAGGIFAGDAVTWTDVTVPAGGSVTLGLVVRVADPVPEGLDAISNQATADGVPTCASFADPDICLATAIPLQPGTTAPPTDPAVIPVLDLRTLLGLMLAFALTAGVRLGRRD